ncbi:integrase domain-containing protein [Shinella yambaruensis]|uniref:Integrase n=1 Tax=Shinella yambaruensis TaxID=415996 RepID=A0ABQ5ZP51_9HYPH|nr:phage integrase N-terminal domain-containing protein [Shinella yambaruensis]MCJ8028363.1 integrase domain-containing protein [Shinella yambaruensis]MCU7981416.1 integrase domain-containing protein [Shinella yambaruensis]GLR53554.1 integrase [Shinella yambaruensis]
MDDLTYELKQLCRRNRDGSFQTQHQRMQSLTLMARQLKEMGFRNMRATSLKEKHVDALLERWTTENLSAGTIRNRMSHLRYWAGKVGKAGVIPADNAMLGIPQRQSAGSVSGDNRAKDLGDGHLDRVTDPHVHMSLRLQQAFGLRREECIKFQPAYADRGGYIALKGSWTKGGRERTVPITTAEQRAVLSDAHALAGSGALIPAHRNYIEQRHVYDGQCKAAGLSNVHGLRHAYAQSRYEALTGWKSPAAGGPAVRELTPEQRAVDAEARQQISRELGHERIQITSVYLRR